MSIFQEITTRLPTPEELFIDIPQTGRQFDFVMKSREKAEAILQGRDKRLMLIIGPCSVHDPQALLEYAEKFKELAEEVEERFYLVLRAYFEKPRTTIGWKGFLLDPALDGSYEIERGVREVRQLLSDLTDLGVPIGSEILELLTFPYYSDYLAWGCIGARTSSSPPHRQLAAGLPFPMGFKNSLDGNVDTAIQGVIAANNAHSYLAIGIQGQLTKLYGEGNRLAHVVLRGSEHRPNYHPKDIEQVTEKCKAFAVCDKVLIDCSHGNCFKNYLDQIPAFRSVLEQSISNSHIAGAMLESHLFAGNQSISSNLKYGVSITDPCLDWATTRDLILEML